MYFGKTYFRGERPETYFRGERPDTSSPISVHIQLTNATEALAAVKQK